MASRPLLFGAVSPSVAEALRTQRPLPGTPLHAPKERAALRAASVLVAHFAAESASVAVQV